MKMVLAVCARAQSGATPADREQAVEEGIARALRFARWSFPARELPTPIIQRFQGTAIISWSNEPSTWTLAGYTHHKRAAADGVGYVGHGYSGAATAGTTDLLAYAATLGGCFNLFRASDHRIEAVTDATKSNSVYVSSTDRLWVLASRALLAHMVCRGSDQPQFDLKALATMPAKGQLIGNGTPFEGVSALGISEHVVLSLEGARRTSSAPESDGVLSEGIGQEWDGLVSATADALVRAFDPLVGGDVHFALTGGRDSRVIAAALARHGQIGVSTHTLGTSSDPDVVLAAEIAELCGWTHTVNAPSRMNASNSGLLAENPVDRINRVLDVHDGMNSAWDDIEDYGQVRTLPIMSGVGGEILRGGLVLTSHATMSPELAIREIRAAIGNGKFLADEYRSSYGHTYIETAQDDPYRAVDDFYYHERNGRWVASRRMGARFRRRVVDPLLDNQFIRATRSIDPSIRWAERLAFALIAELHPPLRDVRVEGERWRFERLQPDPVYSDGWGARTALARERRGASFNPKNLTDKGMRALVDEIILDGLHSGPAAELLDRAQVEQFLASDTTYPGLRWHLATTVTLLTSAWWKTERPERRESIPVRNDDDYETAEDMHARDSTEPLTPAVSVIVPMHNSERHIQDTLESLSSQSLLNFEVIVVDDGSSDRSPEIVDAFAARDDRFRRIPGPALGSAGAARNAGLESARGEYVAFLDADDLFAPSMLEKLYRRAQVDNADVVLTGFRSMNDVTGEQKAQKWALRIEWLPEQTPFSPEDIADHLFYITNPANWNKLFRRQFVVDQDLRFQQLRRANDAFFTFVALATARRISYVAEELVLYRVGNAASLQGSIHETPLDFVDAITAISDRLYNEGLDRLFHRALMNLVVTMSLGALNRANTGASFAATYAAVRDSLFPRYGVTNADPDLFLVPTLQQRAQEIVHKPLEHWLFDRVNPPTPVASLDPALGDENSASISTETSSAGPSKSDHNEASTIETRPDVSVIVPVYNSAPWLHECLLSILGQSGVSIEVICVNDGSTDDSSRILHEYSTSDKRVTVIDQPNGGLSVARNTGLDAARGRYTCLIDSDDYWRVDELSKLVERADRDSLDALLFDAESFFEPGVSEKTHAAYATYYTRTRSYSDVVTGAELIAKMRDAKEYRPSACLYLMRTDLVNEANLRFLPGIMHEDNPFTFALLLAAGRTAHEKRAMYARRVRPGSIMTAGAKERSMQGYIASYLDMNARLSRMRVAPELIPQLGDVVHHMYTASRRLFIDLPPEVEERMLTTAPSPEAYSTYLVLRHERNQARKIQRLSERR